MYAKNTSGTYEQIGVLTDSDSDPRPDWIHREMRAMLEIEVDHENGIIYAVDGTWGSRDLFEDGVGPRGSNDPEESNLIMEIKFTDPTIMED